MNSNAKSAAATQKEHRKRVPPRCSRAPAMAASATTIAQMEKAAGRFIACARELPAMEEVYRRSRGFFSATHSKDLICRVRSAILKPARLDARIRKKAAHLH